MPKMSTRKAIQRSAATICIILALIRECSSFLCIHRDRRCITPQIKSSSFILQTLFGRELNRSGLLVLHSVDFLAGYGYIEGKPKTSAGKRAVSLPTFLLDMLAQHRVQQLALRATVSDWEDRDLVFPNLKGGYLHPNHLGESFRELLKEAGLSALRFHDLRHNAATILLARGVNIKVVSELLGHSDIVITLRTYGHLLPSMQSDAVDSWRDGFENSDEDDNDDRGVPASST